MLATAHIRREDLRPRRDAGKPAPTWTDAPASAARVLATSDRDHVKRAFRVLRARGVRANMLTTQAQYDRFDPVGDYALIVNASRIFDFAGKFRQNPVPVLAGHTRPDGTFDPDRAGRVADQIVEVLRACELDAARPADGNGWVIIRTPVGQPRP